MPDDDARSTQIERSINREIADSMTMVPHGGSIFTVAPRSIGEILEFAKLMAVSGICVRPMFRGNPGACLAVTLQAMKIGADPFAVANKAYEVNGQLSYESQLVHSIVNTSPALARRLSATYSGEGQTRKCLVVGFIKGEDEGREYESPKLGEITPKNSPLWKSDPDQQLFYYATRAWARRWVPEVLLGIYTPEELSTRTIELEAVPAEEPRREDFVSPATLERENIVGQALPQREEIASKDERPRYAVIDLDGVEHEYVRAGSAKNGLLVILEDAAKRGAQFLDGAWASNESLRQALPNDHFLEVRKRYDELGESLGSPQASESVQTAPGAAKLAEPTPAPPESAAAVSAPDPEVDARNTDLAIAPVLRKGVPDWRTWAVALFLPKVRQAKTTTDLAFLVGDNDVHLRAARAALPAQDRADLDHEIQQRFGEIDNGN